MKNVSNINAQHGMSNLPGLNKVRVIDVNDVLSIKYPHRAIPPKELEDDVLVIPSGHKLVDGGVTLKEGAKFTNLYFSPGQGDFTESLSKTAHGGLWNSNVSITCPGDSPDVRACIEVLKNMRVLVLCLDNDNKPRLMGTLKQPCEVMIEFSTSSLKSRKISFNALTKRQAYFSYAWANDEFTGIGSEFSNEFNLDFNA